MTTPPLSIFSFRYFQYNFTYGLKYNEWTKSLLIILRVDVNCWTKQVRGQKIVDGMS